MFLRCHASADHPFANKGSALRVPFSENFGHGTDQGFPASRLSPQEGMVECPRHGTWMIYSLPTKPPLELQLILNAFKTLRLLISGSVPIPRPSRRCDLTADGLMKPSKTNALDLLRPHESHQISFHHHVPLHGQLPTEYFCRIPVEKNCPRPL
jgi:hypothetical protein